MNDYPINSSEKKEKKSFSFSKKIDGVKKTVSGEEVENGWIITIDKEWKEKNHLNESEEYKYGCWKYISKENPMDKYDEEGKPKAGEPDDQVDISSMFAEINKAQGLISV